MAAAGATTSAMMVLGTASTGTAISRLFGVTATNATLAALGGGIVAACGRRMALGAAIHGASTLGVGLLYDMCKVKLVFASDTDTEKNLINYAESNLEINKTVAFLEAK